MPAAHPKEFRDDVIAVARRGGAGAHRGVRHGVGAGSRNHAGARRAVSAVHVGGADGRGAARAAPRDWQPAAPRRQRGRRWAAARRRHRGPLVRRPARLHGGAGAHGWGGGCGRVCGGVDKHLLPVLPRGAPAATSAAARWCDAADPLLPARTHLHRARRVVERARRVRPGHCLAGALPARAGGGRTSPRHGRGGQPQNNKGEER